MGQTEATSSAAHPNPFRSDVCLLLILPSSPFTSSPFMLYSFLSTSRSSLRSLGPPVSFIQVVLFILKRACGHFGVKINNQYRRIHRGLLGQNVSLLTVFKVECVKQNSTVVKSLTYRDVCTPRCNRCFQMASV